MQLLDDLCALSPPTAAAETLAIDTSEHQRCRFYYGRLRHHPWLLDIYIEGSDPFSKTEQANRNLRAESNLFNGSLATMFIRTSEPRKPRQFYPMFRLRGLPAEWNLDCLTQKLVAHFGFHDSASVRVGSLAPNVDPISGTFSDQHMVATVAFMNGVPSSLEMSGKGSEPTDSSITLRAANGSDNYDVTIDTHFLGLTQYNPKPTGVEIGE